MQCIHLAKVSQQNCPQLLWADEELCTRLNRSCSRWLGIICKIVHQPLHQLVDHLFFRFTRPEAPPSAVAVAPCAVMHKWRQDRYPICGSARRNIFPQCTSIWHALAQITLAPQTLGTMYSRSRCTCRRGTFRGSRGCWFSISMGLMSESGTRF